LPTEAGGEADRAGNSHRLARAVIRRGLCGGADTPTVAAPLSVGFGFLLLACDSDEYRYKPTGCDVSVVLSGAKDQTRGDFFLCVPRQIAALRGDPSTAAKECRFGQMAKNERRLSDHRPILPLHAGSGWLFL